MACVLSATSKAIDNLVHWLETSVQGARHIGVHGSPPAPSEPSLASLVNETSQPVLEIAPLPPLPQAAYRAKPRRERRERRREARLTRTRLEPGVRNGAERAVDRKPPEGADY